MKARPAIPELTTGLGSEKRLAITTGVPSLVAPNRSSANLRGMRTQPCEAG